VEEDVHEVVGPRLEPEEPEQGRPDPVDQRPVVIRGGTRGETPEVGGEELAQVRGPQPRVVDDQLGVVEREPVRDGVRIGQEGRGDDRPPGEQGETGGVPELVGAQTGFSTDPAAASASFCPL